MLNLINTSSKIQVITGSAVAVDVSASYVDYDGSTVTPGGNVSKITTAATTDIVAVPGASTYRNIKSLSITNIHGASSNLVTLQHYDGTSTVILWYGTLLAGEQLKYTDTNGFVKYTAGGVPQKAMTFSGVVAVANGGTNASSASITAFNNITGLSAAGTTGTTSTNLVFSTSPTLVTPVLGAATLTSAQFNVAISAASWTTSGLRIKGGPVTLTNTTSSGTVALSYTDLIGGDTLAASSATTYTNYVGTHFKDPVQGSNVTLTKGWSLGADTLRVKKSFGSIVSGTTANAFYLEQSGGGDGGASCTHRMFSYNLYTNGSNNLNEATAFIGNIYHQASAGTCSTSTVVNATTRVQGAGAVTTVEGMIVGISFSSTGNVVNYWGFHATAPSKSSTGLITGIAAAFRAERMGALGTTTSAYGIYIDAQYGAATNNYAIYIANHATSGGTAAEGISWNNDTNFYRSAAAKLKTDGSLIVGKVITSGVATLTDGATPALDASLGNTFLLTAAGDRTIAVPTNATSGQRITIVHKASGGARTLALNTGAGGFRFGTTITALTATGSGLTDYIECIYNLADTKWDVINVIKGF